MNKVKKWFKEHDSSGTYERTFLNMIRQGKSLRQLEGILNSYGMQKVSTESIRRYIDSLDSEISTTWRSQRPQNRILRKLRKKLNLDEARKEFIDENTKLCPFCHRILESSNLHIILEKHFDMKTESVCLRCPFCHGIVGYSDYGVYSVEDMERIEREERSRELYGF